MRGFLSFVIVSVWLGQALAKDYDGEFCTGVVDFAIANTANVAKLDSNAKDSYSLFPRWIAEECLAAAWKFSCMYEYGVVAEDDAGYCRDSCIATLDSCKETIELLGDNGELYIAVITSLCASQTDPATNEDCHTGGNVTYSDIPSGYEALCPKPLGRAVPLEGASMQEIDGTACALPCPAIVFTEDEWQLIRDIMVWGSFVSLILSLAVVLTHPEPKNSYIRLLNFGGIALSLIVFLFLTIDDYEEQTCVDDVHYHQRSPLCLTQAFFSVGLYVWMLAWQACISLNLWISVVLQVKGDQLKSIQQMYLPACALCSLIAPVVAIAAGNLGFDPIDFSGPMCLFLFSEEEGYYWALFFTPIMIIVVTSLVLMVHSIVYVNKVLNLQKGTVSLGKGLKRFLKLLKYNRKMFQFMLCFCLLGAYQCGQILYSNRIDDSGIQQSTIKYVECLFEYATDNPESGRQACGDHPTKRTPIWQVVLLVAYYVTIGICSFLVYGTQGKARKLVKSGIRRMRTTFQSGTAEQSNDASNSGVTSYSDTSDARTPPSSPRASPLKWQFRKSPRASHAQAASAELDAVADDEL